MGTTTTIRRKSAYHHGDLRAQLIETARQMVESEGADHFSVAKACRAAGVSSAAPYRHFRDREEMLAEVIRTGRARKIARMLDALEAHPEGSLARIVALGHVYVGFARDEPGVFRLIFGRTNPEICETPVPPDAAAPDSDDDPMRALHIVRGEVASVMGRPHVDDEVCNRAFLLWTFVHGLSFLLIDGRLADGGVDIDLDATLQEVAERVLA